VSSSKPASLRCRSALVWPASTRRDLAWRRLRPRPAGYPSSLATRVVRRKPVREGETGFVVPSGDHALLAERLILLLDNPALAQDMGARGRRYVAAHFSTAVARARLGEALSIAP
jgi:hypothetical protein